MESLKKIGPRLSSAAAFFCVLCLMLFSLEPTRAQQDEYVSQLPHKTTQASTSDRIMMQVVNTNTAAETSVTATLGDFLGWLTNFPSWAGITAAQGTNIAAYQANIATNRLGSAAFQSLSIFALLNAVNDFTAQSNVFEGPIYVDSNSQPTIIYGSATVDGTFTNGGPAYFSNNIVALPGAKFAGDLSLGTNLPAIQLAQRGYHIPTNGVIAYANGTVTVDCSRAIVTIPTNNSFQIILGNTAAGTNSLTSIVVTNFGASTIYATNPATSRPIGAVTTNALALASGKQGYFSTDTIQGVRTNYCNASEQ